jgi:hypothetical protein
MVRLRKEETMDQFGRSLTFAEKFGIALLLVALTVTGLLTAEVFATGGSMLQVDATSDFSQF